MHIAYKLAQNKRHTYIQCFEELQAGNANFVNECAHIQAIISLLCFFLHVIYYGEMSVLIVSPFVT